ncbi:MAG: 6-bladed beta-propeller [Tannerellaceae bacterium]|jgi:hypothetical protein|nr:6-bladed beta-propeller [Tannerellaceae bacterium]
MKNLMTISAAILYVMTGCGESKQTADGFITVDVTASYPKKELILQDFMDVEYVPLETTDEFITSAYVQAIGKDIILVRNTNQAGPGDIFIFDRTGKGVRKINRRGQGNEEYTNITGTIALDEENGEMFVNCGGLRKILVYDLFGNFKRSFDYMEGEDESSMFKKEIGYNPICNFDRNNLIFQDCTNARNFMGRGGVYVDLDPRDIFYIISKQDGSITKKIPVPFEKKILQIVFHPSGGVGKVSNLGLTPYHDRWILVEPSADTVYSYSADHVMKPFIVRTPSVQSMDPEVFLFPGVITDRYCFMQSVKKEYDETESGSNLKETDLVYDRQEKKIFEYTVYNDDFTTKRPLKNLVDDVLTLTVVNHDEVAFSEKIEAPELVEAYRKGQLKGRLKEIAATLDEESNPVIMLAKYKKQ